MNKDADTTPTNSTAVIQTTRRRVRFQVDIDLDVDIDEVSNTGSPLMGGGVGEDSGCGVLGSDKGAPWSLRT
jgi:hypothetical protein